MYRVPDSHLKVLTLFATAGAAESVAGKMPYKGTPPPNWTKTIFVPGLPPIASQINDLNKQISDLQDTRNLLQQQLEDRAAYRKLLYEKGKIQLEPIVLRALDDLELGTSTRRRPPGSAGEAPKV